MEWLPWMTPVVGTAALLVALFKEEIVRIWRRPDLHASIHFDQPDCGVTTMYLNDGGTGQALHEAKCYTFRIRVENRGRERAERVQVYASELHRKHASGVFHKEKNFLPLNLQWMPGGRNGSEIFADVINPRMMRHCHLGHIIDPAKNESFGHVRRGVDPSEAVFALFAEVAPNSRSHLLTKGEYRLVLRIAASNALPKSKTLTVTISGNWHEDEAKMLSDGIGII